MFTADKVAKTSYISDKPKIQKKCSDKEYLYAPKISSDKDVFVKNDNTHKNRHDSPSIADNISGFFGCLVDSLSYYATNKASKDTMFSNFIVDKNICDITAKLSQQAYRKEPRIIDGWKPCLEEENKSTGFKAVAYKNKDHIIISYCGTNDTKDVASDMQLGLGKIPEQYIDANNFYLKVCENNPECSVGLTGHSLGGSLAELVASKHEKTAAVTFNAYGVDKIVNSECGKKLNMKENYNSFNYIVDGDPVSNSSKHVGSTTIVQQKADVKNKHIMANFINMWV